MTIPEIDSLEWSEPKTVSNGRYTLKVAAPTEGFWKLYRAHKQELLDAGIKVQQFKGEWQVNWWMNGGGFKYPTLPQESHEERYSPLPSKLEIALVLKPLVNESGFKPWQPPIVQHMVAVMEQDGSVALDACGTGVGKTFITLGAIRERDRRALVICPKVLTIKWQRTAYKMSVDCVGAYGWEWIKTGKTPFGHWEKEYNRGGHLKKKGKSKFVWTIPDDVDLVFDECHRASGMDTQNATLVIAATNQGVPRHLLSATVADSPVKMRANGYALDLHQDGNGFYNWMYSHGVIKKQFMVGQREVTVYKFDGTKQQLQRLHRSIFPSKGMRLKPEDIADFPKTVITAEPYEMDNHLEIRHAYEEMQYMVAKIEADRDMEARDKQASILVEILRARQKVELLKVPLMVSLTRDSVEEGNSVILAVNFKETLKQLADQLDITCIIAGVSTGKFILPQYSEFLRQTAVDDFLADKTRICAGIIAAMREGLDLDDQNGTYPREVFISPCQSSFHLKQVLGRACRAGGKSPSRQSILFAAKTIEEQVCEGLAKKLDCLDLICDGDLGGSIFPEGYSDMRE